MFRRGEQSQIAEWRTDNSIFNFLSDNRETEGNLKDVVHKLPDEVPEDENKYLFAPGL